LGDIDHVLVGPPGVFALEVKNWSGKIEYSDDTSTWTRTKPRQFQSEVLKDPAEQVVQLSGVLGAALKEKAVPVVVFVNPNSTISTSDHPRATVLTLAQLRKWVTSQPARFTPEKVDALAAVLNKSARKTADQTPPADKAKFPAPAATPRAAVPEPPKPGSRAGRGCRIAVPIILVLSLVAVVFVYFAVKSIGITQPSGCTKVVTTYIRSGPSLNDELLGTASKGTCFNFDGRTSDGYWVRITGINGFRGGWTTVNYIDLSPEELKDLPIAK
jgi:Nuclease-related domain